MRTLTKREQVILGLTILILGYGAGYYGLIMPLEEEIHAVERKISAEKRNYLADQKALKKAAVMEADFQFLQEHFAQKTTNEGVLSEFLKAIENVAADLDINISEIKPYKVQKADGINRFSISLTIQSEMDQVLQFIHILQSQPYYYNVQEFNFQKIKRRKGVHLRSNLVLTRSFFQ